MLRRARGALWACVLVGLQEGSSQKSEFPSQRCCRAVLRVALLLGQALSKGGGMTCRPTCPTGVYAGGRGHKEPAHREAGGRD